MTATEHVTFCRICEPLCGMIATVEDGRLTQLRPDPNHAGSQGFACPKGIAFAEVHNDDDRVLQPLRRRPDGSFEQVTWAAAMADIGTRLRQVVRSHGSGGVGWYYGNPTFFNFGALVAIPAFLEAIGSPHAFTSNSQDGNARAVASHFLYGSQITLPVPDIDRCDLLVIVGANPVVSHGSGVSKPRIKEALRNITKRGGRVVVIDPRRTETAEHFEWLPVTPDTDALLLLSLLYVLFEERLVDRARLDTIASGIDSLRRLALAFDPERTEEATGVKADTVRTLARDLARTPRAALYSRLGASLGQHGTLTTYLVDVVNVVAGNLDVEGGAMFGSPGLRRLLARLERLSSAGYDSRRSRIGGFPQVLGTEPATIMAREIITPGPGQVRALFVSAGNPVLSAPDGSGLEAALATLDLFVSIDLYVNETNCQADYVLPATTMYERDDVPLVYSMLQTTPLRQATRAVVAPRGEAKQESEIVGLLLQELQTVSPRLRAVDGLRRVLSRIPMARVADFVVRVTEGGDGFGLRRGGLTLRLLLDDHPHGTVVRETLRPGVLHRVVTHRDRRVRLDVPELYADVAHLWARADVDPDFPMRLIGMRHRNSENSWMHNIPMLTRTRPPHAVHLHPEDARAAGIEAGQRVRVSSRHDRIELPAAITDDLKPGVAAIPHGWGHSGTGGWQRANGIGGANVNQLMSADPVDVEFIGGMSHLNGVAIRIERVGTDPLLQPSAEPVSAE